MHPHRVQVVAKVHVQRTANEEEEDKKEEEEEEGKGKEEAEEEGRRGALGKVDKQSANMMVIAERDHERARLRRAC